MGVVEARYKKRRKKSELQDLIVKSIQAAGMVAVFAMAPNAIVAMKKAGLIPHPRQKESVRRAWKRLVRAGLIAEKDGCLQLTGEGQKYYARICMYDALTNRPPRWDERWRVLMFDIPENRKATRHQVRLTLAEAGFRRLQDSVWIYPYPCEEFIALLKADIHIGEELLYMVADSIDSDSRLRAEFDLPPAETA